MAGAYDWLSVIQVVICGLRHRPSSIVYTGGPGSKPDQNYVGEETCRTTCEGICLCTKQCYIGKGRIDINFTTVFTCEKSSFALARVI